MVKRRSPSQAEPREGRHFVVQLERCLAAADEVALLGLLRMFAQECQQVPRVGERWVVGPLHLDGGEFALAPKTM